MKVFTDNDNIIDSFDFVMSEGDHFSTMTTIPKVIPVFRHGDLTQFLNSMHGYEADDSDFFFYDGTGVEHRVPKEEIEENIRTCGVWGMVRNDEELHLWYDSFVVDERELVRFISHELGHFQRPFKRDPDLEEMKAEHYSDIACMTYNMINLIKKRFNEYDIIGEPRGIYRAQIQGDIDYMAKFDTYDHEWGFIAEYYTHI